MEPVGKKEVPRPWAAGGTVLVVDDEAEIRAVAEKMLTFLGFKVVLAGNGPDALKALRQQDGSLTAALVDLTMPGTPGEEVVRDLRRAHDVPVIHTRDGRPVGSRHETFDRRVVRVDGALGR